MIKNNWQTKKLGEVCKYNKGKKPKKLVSEKQDNIAIPYINIKAFEKGIFDEYTDGEKCNLCEDGDLLMVWDGARAGFSGKAKKGAVGSTLMKIEPLEEIVEKNFIYYFLQSIYKKLNTNPRGVGIPHVEPTLLWEAELIVPPLETQHAIVTKIEELFSELDKGITELKTAQQQLKTYRQSVLKSAFEGKLTNENVKDGELPEGWKSKSLKGLVLKVEKVKRKEVDENEELIYLDIGGINNDSNRIENYKKFFWKDAPSRAQQIVKQNDILFSTVRTYMKNIAIVDKEIYNNQIASSGFTVLRADTSVDYKYIYYNTISDVFLNPLNELQTGTSYPAVRDSDVLSQTINLPSSSEEQHLIVQEIESRLSVADKMEQSIQESLQKAEALRQSILKKAFSGELV